MDPELQARLRNYFYINKFKTHSNKVSSNRRHNTWSFYKAFKSGLIFPTVHAAEVSKNEKEFEDISTEINTDSNIVTPGSEEMNENTKEISKKIVVPDEEVRDYIARETGMDRLKEMFTKTNIGNESSELKLIINCTVFSGVFTGLIAHYLTLYKGRREFKLQNKGVTFRDNNSAVRIYMHNIYKEAMTVGLQWYCRSAAFVGIFLSISQLIPVYRNKTSPIDYGVAGFVTGGLWRFFGGPKAMFAAGVFIGAGGLFVGSVMYALLHFKGLKQEQKHFVMIKEMLEEEKFYASHTKKDCIKESNQNVMT